MPMSTRQAKLLKLAEECAEVAQACSKQSYYGPDHIHDEAKNRDNLRNELLDVLVCARILTSLGEIEPIYEHDILKHFVDKLPKIRKYTKIAFDLGALDECWIPTLENLL